MSKEMTAREYLENKYPQMRGDKWNTHDVIDDNRIAQMMTEFSDLRAKEAVKEFAEELIEYSGVFKISDYDIRELAKQKGVEI